MRGGDLSRLKLDRVDLYQLHRIAPKVPLAEQGVLTMRVGRNARTRHSRFPRA
ncbi:hypothetical protein [Streptomyces millisiae]|uniref:Aldo/keto reductase n=1 Tax=Streptomyces millisiae TaxID=3075542 RepID=A0ABU2LHM0_9ACTN|nr:hypothetical protein [Streptomyces sp. DSM 44918]MDT0317081.1 hypothetical protein [Streptomyces sp. DSM 44918]